MNEDGDVMAKNGDEGAKDGDLGANDDDVFALLDFTRCTIVCAFKPKCNS